MAVEATVSICGAKIVDCFWAPIERQFRYMCRYDDNFANLSRQVKKLKEAIGELEERVAAAERNLQTKKEDVTQWVEMAKAQKEEADTILDDRDKVGKGFLKGWCLSLKSRYLLGKKAAKKAQALEVVITDGKFDTVADPHLPSGIVSTPAGTGGSEVMHATKKTDQLVVDTKSAPQASTSVTTSGGGFEFRLSTMRDVMEALKDDNIRMIRICGMGGIGKTTMLNEVEEWARGERMFDEIGKAELTLNPDVERIQGHIAESLGLELKNDGLKARADRLRKRLNDKDKKILVILDNVWRRSHLEEVGVIPLAGEDMGYRILLTSRNEDVCVDIRPQKMFRVGFLSDPDALTLFQATLGSSTYDPPHMDLIAIVKECGGLPLAIVAIARALVNGDEDTWKYALEQLEKSALEGGEYARVNESLELSYKFLKPEEIKDFFLLCCLFPQGFDVPIEHLVRYGVGLRLFKNIDNVHDARIKAHEHVKTLKHANLFLGSDKEECVKMHDVVRDFALSTASKGLFMVRYGDRLKEWPNTYEHYTRVSLQCNKMDELPDGLECPKLELLKFIGFNRSLKFPDNFFEGMSELNVLAIFEMPIRLPPESFQHLTNLRTLSLNKCYLDDGILIIENLKKLEVLSFANSWIYELPKQIEKLTQLRLLDLSGCGNLRKIAAGVLSSLIRLEELYMRDTINFYWAKEGAEQTQASFSEVKSLKNLVVLEIRLPYKALPTDSLFENLKKFDISTGDFVWPVYQVYEESSELWEHMWFEEEENYGFQNSLKLTVDRSALVQHRIKSLLRKTGVMILQVGGLKTLHGDETEIGDSSKLKNLTLESCNELVYLVNRMPPLDQNKVFRVLDSLCLYDLNNLEDVYHVQHSKESLTEIEPIDIPVSENLRMPPAHQLTSFGNLRVLDVKRCRKLENIFSLSIAKGLVKLERLQIVDCQMMKEIVSQDRGDEVGKIGFPNLRYLILDSLPNMVAFCKAADVVDLPQLVQLKLGSVPQLISRNPFFYEKVTFTSLEDLSIKGMNLPESELREMEVSNCNKLVVVLSSQMIQRFHHLKELSVKDCDSMEVVFDLEELIVGEDNKFEILDRLKYLRLSRLRRMAHVWKKGPQGFVGFQSLTRLEVEHCESIKYLFSPLIAKLLVELQRLIIRNCRMMEEVVCERDEAEDQEHASDVPFFPKLYHISLQKLQNLRLCFGRGASNVGYSGTHHEGNDNQSISSPIFHKKLSFAGLENSKSRPALEGIAALRQLPAWSLYHLNQMVVENCHRLLYVIPSNSVARLRNLTRLRVLRCDSVVEIFEVEGFGCTVKIPQLDDVELQFLPELMYVWRHEGRVLGFPNLKSVTISRCDRLEYLFCWSTVESLVNLESLSISECWMMKEVIVKEDDDEVEAARTNKLRVFPRLRSLSLKRLPKLGRIFSEKLAFEFEWPSLKRLYITDCIEMMIFTPGHSSTPNLKEITVNLRTFPLDGDLNTTLMNSQQKVCSEMVVEYCHGLLYVIPSSAVARLRNLTRLGVLNCDSVVEIFEVEGLGGPVTIPQLEDVELKYLPELMYIWRHERCMLGFPNLKRVSIYDCNRLEYLFCWSTVESLVHLEEMDISYCKMMKEVIVKEDDDEVETARTGKLHVFPRLQSLRLRDLPKLGRIFSEKLAFEFEWPSLEDLYITYCHEMMIFTPGHSSTPNLKGFPNLKSVTIMRCDRLEYLFCWSTVESLVHLEEMDISKCRMMKEVIVKEDDDDVEVARTSKLRVFPRLRSLYLQRLPKLGRIFSEKLAFEFEWPSLEYLYIHKCHEMMIFTPGHSSTPNLKEITVNLRTFPLDGDLNTTLMNSQQEEKEDGVE